jgi:hypothetical protein
VSSPSIHGRRPVVSASTILEELGDALSRIRQEDRLTWSDIGAVLGKSEDQAAKYADASAEMGVVALYRAKQAWNGRFTGAADKLVTDVSPEPDAQTAQSCILRAALALSTALEDGKLTDAEIRANRSTLEMSRDAIDGLLARLGPKAGAA